LFDGGADGLVKPVVGKFEHWLDPLGTCGYDVDGGLIRNLCAVVGVANASACAEPRSGWNGFGQRFGLGGRLWLWFGKRFGFGLGLGKWFRLWEREWFGERLRYGRWY
jgi:hypothetical protein